MLGVCPLTHALSRAYLGRMEHTNSGDTRIMRPREVAQRLGVSSTTLWRYAKRPDFPRAFRLGPNAVGFDSGELELWVAGRRVTAA